MIKITLVWDPVNELGLTFNIIILVFGYWSYKKSQDKVPLYISIAFVLFGVSYLITLLGLKRTLESVLILKFCTISNPTVV